MHKPFFEKFLNQRPYWPYFFKRKLGLEPHLGSNQKIEIQGALSHHNALLYIVTIAFGSGKG